MVESISSSDGFQTFQATTSVRPGFRQFNNPGIETTQPTNRNLKPAFETPKSQRPEQTPSATPLVTASIQGVNPDKLVAGVQKVAQQLGYLPMSDRKILQAYQYGESMFVDRLV